MGIANDIYTMEAWISNIIIIAASFIFLSKFTALKQKNYGLYMILILAIADLTFPLTNIIQLFVHNPTIENILNSLGLTIYQFSLYWSMVIAFFVYLVVKGESLFNPKIFISRALVLCTLFSLFFFLL